MTALNTVMLNVVYAECCYAECRYAVYHYAECHSALQNPQARYDLYNGTLTKWEDLLQLTSLL